MLSFLSRVLGILCVAVALVTAVIDGTKSIAASQLVTTPFGAHWYEFAPESLNAAQAAVQRHVAVWLWDPVIQWILLLPTWGVAGALGALFVWMGTRRRRRNYGVA
ncbi:hypothetical protein [Breoghania sp.]|uniref:hypothetical protein n=1 Tax=Breoghania sp. TaxID=2065378 RepID=UPI0029C9DED4|nr:hypothetical protein [Breoghania sp.]